MTQIVWILNYRFGIVIGHRKGYEEDAPPPKLKSNDLCSEYGVEYILFNSQGKNSEIIEEGESEIIEEGE